MAESVTVSAHGCVVTQRPRSPDTPRVGAGNLDADGTALDVERGPTHLPLIQVVDPERGQDGRGAVDDAEQLQFEAARQRQGVVGRVAVSRLERGRGRAGTRLSGRSPPTPAHQPAVTLGQCRAALRLPVPMAARPLGALRLRAAETSNFPSRAAQPLHPVGGEPTGMASKFSRPEGEPRSSDSTRRRTQHSVAG
jgi:hypothetical protein